MTRGGLRRRAEGARDRAACGDQRNGEQERRGAQDRRPEAKLRIEPGLHAISQRLRKRIEEGFGWGKTVAGLTQVKVRGLDKVRAAFVFAIAAYDIVRLPKLLAPTGEMGPAA